LLSRFARFGVGGSDFNSLRCASGGAQSKNLLSHASSDINKGKREDGITVRR